MVFPPDNVSPYHLFMRNEGVFVHDEEMINSIGGEETLDIVSELGKDIGQSKQFLLLPALLCRRGRQYVSPFQDHSRSSF